MEALVETLEALFAISVSLLEIFPVLVEMLEVLDVILVSFAFISPLVYIFIPSLRLEVSLVKLELLTSYSRKYDEVIAFDAFFSSTLK